MDNKYNEFIKKKTNFDYNNGFKIQIDKINSLLFEWQKYIVKWGVHKGRAAFFEDCGLGKTIQQIEWLHLIMQLTKDSDGIGLIICPLNVIDQTILEADKLGYALKYVKTIEDCQALGLPIFITNYEIAHKFKGYNIKAIVLDESSILKSIDGVTKDLIIEISKTIKYRLSCTATPSPNDISELGNQVEFLGIMSRKEMLAKFFVKDSKINGYRLKGHAKNDFYKWMASWCVFIRKPSDIGFSDNGYILPKLNIIPLWVDSEYVPDGELLPVSSVKGLSGRFDIRRKTLDDKIKIISDMVNKSNEQWIIFSKLNTESQAVSKVVNDCHEVSGNTDYEKRNQIFNDFKSGKIKVISTKFKIGAHGLNFQNAHNMIIIGADDSFELYYQCIRREYRYNQKYQVNVYIVLTNSEQVILNNVLAKENEHNILSSEVIKEMCDFSKEEIKNDHVESHDIHEIKVIENNYYKIILGDSIETIKSIPDNSVHMQIFSPPFFSLYTYSPSSRDIGNNKDDQEFWDHFGFLIPDLLRVLMPGRVCAVHCMDVPSTLVNDGVIGTKDLRGDIIRAFCKHGFIWDNCAVIPKNPQAQSIRTHAKGLTFTQFEKDSAWSRPALMDYLLKFRKPGENKIPVRNGDNGEVSRDEWIELASGVWSSVNETNTLNTTKYHGDEKHMCPLQLDTIHNAVRLWSNPGELIHSPFAGIGSEGFQSILDKRRFLGQELKKKYFEQMIKNLEHAISKTSEGELFAI